MPGTVTAQTGNDKVMLVLDASGSMWGRLGDVTKIEIARGVIGDLMADWNPAVDLGLSAYGHRRKGDCHDIETLIPVGGVEPAAVMAAVNALQPRGKTPLSRAVRMAAEELKYTDEAATVILVSDGEETCGADPCALGSELEQSGIDFTAHVIGFDVDEERAAGLRCLAENTGGRFLSARDASTLLTAMQEAVEEIRPPAERKVSTPISSGCQSTGLVCEPAYDVAVVTSGVLKVQFHVSGLHCGRMKVRYSLDGEERHTSQPLGAGGQEPVSTEVVDLGPVEAGEHTVTLQAIGVPGGCIVDRVSSWGGVVTLWSS